jgi:mRNA interferase HigB
MRIISRKALVKFGKQYKDAAAPLDVWYRIAKKAQWKAPKDVKAQFGNASFLEESITVFNIAGNKYRLVVRVRYDLKRVYVMHVFTHPEYDEWNDSRR